MAKKTKQAREVDPVPEDVASDDGSIEFLSLVAKEAYARGRLDDAIKAIRAISQIRGAIGPGSDARTKEVGKMGTADLIALRESLRKAS